MTEIKAQSSLENKIMKEDENLLMEKLLTPRWYVFQRNSAGKQAWDSLILMCAIYNSFN